MKLIALSSHRSKLKVVKFRNLFISDWNLKDSSFTIPTYLLTSIHLNSIIYKNKKQKYLSKSLIKTHVYSIINIRHTRRIPSILYLRCCIIIRSDTIHITYV